MGRSHTRQTHLANETKALAGDGADQLLLLAVVADCFARGIDAARQGRVGHDAPAPHCRDEVTLADDAIAVFNQMDQKIEYLWFYRNHLGAAAQLSAIYIKPMTGKHKFHVVAPVSTSPAYLKE